MSAQDVRAFRNLSAKLVKVEERSNLLGTLISSNIGVREVEEFVRNEENKLKGSKINFLKKRELVKSAMKIKARDNLRVGDKIRKSRNHLRRTIEDTLGPRSRTCRGIMKSVKVNTAKLRERLKRKNMKKIAFLKGKYGTKQNILEELTRGDMKKYGGAEIFKDECVMRECPDLDPIIVCREGETIDLDDGEKSVLALGPKFCILNKLSEECFQRELEACIVKYRWELRSQEIEEEKVKKFGGDALEAINCIFDEEELEVQAEEEQLEEAKCRMIYNTENRSLNLARRRVTDIKGNSRVILPKKVKNFEVEAKLELLRIECMAVYKKYIEENCQKDGKQKSNLTKNQIKGLLSLKKRIDNAEIVILPTDKTGRFAIMTRETYLQAGLKHTRGDIKVTWEVLDEAQKEINGHVAMLLKIFKVGEHWDHVDRVREYHVR